jgi:hypothetical protein
MRKMAKISAQSTWKAEVVGKNDQQRCSLSLTYPAAGCAAGARAASVAWAVAHVARALSAAHEAAKVQELFRALQTQDILRTNLWHLTAHATFTYLDHIKRQ